MKMAATAPAIMRKAKKPKIPFVSPVDCLLRWSPSIGMALRIHPRISGTYVKTTPTAHPNAARPQTHAGASPAMEVMTLPKNRPSPANNRTLTWFRISPSCRFPPRRQVRIISPMANKVVDMLAWLFYTVELWDLALVRRDKQDETHPDLTRHTLESGDPAVGEEVQGAKLRALPLRGGVLPSRTHARRGRGRKQGMCQRGRRIPPVDARRSNTPALGRTMLDSSRTPRVSSKSSPSSSLEP